MSTGKKISMSKCFPEAFLFIQFICRGPCSRSEQSWLQLNLLRSHTDELQHEEGDTAGKPLGLVQSRGLPRLYISLPSWLCHGCQNGYPAKLDLLLRRAERGYEDDEGTGTSLL